MKNYKCTNESLEAITAGLDLKPSDNVLSICGSGDQPIAISEYAAKVVAIDYNPKQIAYAKRQAEKLQKERFTSFKFKKPRLITLLKDKALASVPRKEEVFSPDEIFWLANFKYFAEKGRLEALSRKVSGIEFVEGDIFNTDFGNDTFDSAYLSNAYGFLGNRPSLKQLVNSIKGNGVLYFVTPVFHRDQPAELGIKLDEDLTEKAVRITRKKLGYNYWMPEIYRKVDA